MKPIIVDVTPVHGSHAGISRERFLTRFQNLRYYAGLNDNGVATGSFTSDELDAIIDILKQN